MGDMLKLNLKKVILCRSLFTSLILLTCFASELFVEVDRFQYFGIVLSSMVNNYYYFIVS